MNILDKIMKEGVLVEPKAAERIKKMDESEQAELMDRIRIEKPLVISEGFFENLIEVSEVQDQKKTSVQESIARINSYFNSLQNLFEKGRAVSISNASGNVSVIGLVKNVLQDGFELEDSTGTIKIISKAQLEEDDVVMVAGKAVSKTIYADLVEFPDIQEKTVKKSSKKCEVLFGKQTEGGDYSIFFGENFSMAKDSVVVGKNPVQIKLNNILILVWNNTKKIFPLQILKKRRLPGTLFAISEVPDIFLSAGENFFENYKGTTVVAVNDKSFARINLKTREVKFESI